MGHKRRRNHRSEAHNGLLVISRESDGCAKYHQNRIKIATVQMMTSGQTNTSNFTSCSPLHCSNHAAKNSKLNTSRLKTISLQTLCFVFTFYWAWHFQDHTYKKYVSKVISLLRHAVMAVQGAAEKSRPLNFFRRFLSHRLGF